MGKCGEAIVDVKVVRPASASDTEGLAGGPSPPTASHREPPCREDGCFLLRTVQFGAGHRDRNGGYPVGIDGRAAPSLPRGHLEPLVEWSVGSV